MGNVISATTGRAYGAKARPSRSENFFAAADHLLAAARVDVDAGRYDLALENAYRAALRIAGARNASSSVLRKRKRLPTSAWDKLALTGDEGARWAGVFSRYSALRGRVASGIETDPSPGTVKELLTQAEAFYLASQEGGAPLAA